MGSIFNFGDSTYLLFPLFCEIFSFFENVTNLVLYEGFFLGRSFCINQNRNTGKEHEISETQKNFAHFTFRKINGDICCCVIVIV